MLPFVEGLPGVFGTTVAGSVSTWEREEGNKDLSTPGIPSVLVYLTGREEGCKECQSSTGRVLPIQNSELSVTGQTGII